MTTKKKPPLPPAVKVANKPAREPTGKTRAQADLATAAESPITMLKSVDASALLLFDLRTLILTTRQHVAQFVNSALTMLYWEIGRRIRQDVLKSKRADYGGKIVAALGRQLEREFGRGFGERNLHRMIQFAVVFPDEKIVSALRTQLG